MAIRIQLGGDNSQQPGCLGLVFMSLMSFFAVGFLGMGLGFAGAILSESYRTALTYTWNRTPCTIVASGVNEKPEKGRPFRFEVRYSYAVAGKPYESQVYRAGYSGSDDYGETRRLAERYNAGLRTVCYVKPTDPTKAVLERESLWKTITVLFPLIFVAIGVGILWAAWRRKKKRPDGSAAPEPISAKADLKNYRILILFFLAFGLFGFGFLIPMFLVPAVNVYRARSWIETPCEIISSGVATHDDTFSIDVFYRYTFRGVEYKSSRYSFITGTSSGYEGKKAVVDRLQPGTKTACYVNPGDPTEAVIERRLTGEMWLALIPLVFAIVGVIGIFFTIRYLRRKKAEELELLTSHVPKVVGLPKVEPAAGPVTLKSARSPLGAFIGVILFAAFWNGIVSVFLVGLIDGWRKGHGDWFLAIFLIPFVAVGIAAIGAIVYFFLRLFNPRPRLTLSSSATPLGGSADLAWELSGHVRSIDKFEITLEGREEATYRQGTNTRTDKQTFAKLPIIAIEDPRDMETGTASFTIPPDTMHSFDAPNNKITWTLLVHGDIAFWPDIKEEFKFVVLPAVSNVEPPAVKDVEQFPDGPAPPGN